MVSTISGSLDNLHGRRKELDDLDCLKAQKKRDVLEITGSHGPWQNRVFLVLFFIYLPGVGQNFGISFLAPDIDFWCAKPTESSNLSTEFWKKFGLPPDDKRCQRYVNPTVLFEENYISGIDLSTQRCKAWEYDHSFYSDTLLEKFDMVCNREWLISLSKSVFMVGILVSSLISGSIADKVGRRPTITGSVILTFIGGVISTFSTSYPLFLTARFLIALGAGGYGNNLFVLLTEVMGPNVRTVYSNAVHLGWSLGFICLPGVVWLLRDCFWVQVAVTAPYLLFCAVWWMIPESPRWLLSKGKTERLKETLRKAAKMNNREIRDMDKILEEIVLGATKNSKAEESDTNMLDLFRTPSLRKITLKIIFSCFSCSFVYYGLSFNTNDLAGDPFVNFAVSGAAEIPGYSMSIVFIRYFGRRKTVAFTLIGSGLMCLLSYFVPDDLTWLAMIVPAIGKFFITSGYSVLYMFATELYPTVIRGSALGMASFFEVMGAIISPFIRELGIATHSFVPFIVFGILAFMGGIQTLLLPETADEALPDTIQEVAKISKKNTDEKI